MWTKRLNRFAKLAWVGLLAVGVALYAAHQRRNLDASPHFRELTQEQAVQAWSGGQVIGDGEAKLVVFSRYTCPFSRALLVRLDGLEVIDDRRPTFRIRHLVHPTDSVAYRAALGVVCADSYGRAREFHSALLQDASQAQMVDLVAIADGTDIDDLAGFRACLTSDEAAASVRADFEHGMELGITGVPALVAGERLVTGSVPEAEIKELLR
ncbi:MAG: thioredoxin domain-containing protein [Gemmatimonadetes bacterium]|nr:thioredoxin domain-containing protein [Gemmatimonadota bacterium]MCY3679422.1 thioredoxin domain-containing protein [Gemmatimonadota bacterium]